MTQREITIIRQMLTEYYRELSKRSDIRSADNCRLINRSLRALDREQQEKRNEHITDTFKSWLKNTKNYLCQMFQR